MRELLERAESRPTAAMTKHFLERTDRHIDLVRKYCERLDEEVPGLQERGEVHDDSKFEDPEYEPYIWLTWRYKCKDDGVEFEGPPGIEARIDAATEHHILSNRHHPEFHQDRKKGLLNAKDRDKPPAELIDATGMSDLDIAEMVADWCAMSEERGNTPTSWADKNVDVRWKFAKAQSRRIYDLIGLAWTQPT